MIAPISATRMNSDLSIVSPLTVVTLAARVVRGRSRPLAEADGDCLPVAAADDLEGRLLTGLELLADDADEVVRAPHR